MNARPVIDVSHLPASVMDHRSQIWWGNLLLLVIETTMFGILVAAYLYIRVVDFDQWPPVQSNQIPVLYHPVPDLGFGTVNLVVLLVSLIPMFWVDRACLKRNVQAVRVGLTISILFGIGTILLRFAEFRGIHFKWNDNAYASVVWTILGIHLAHLITATCENGVMAVWVFLKGLDDKHARDVRVTGVYWYWVVGIWVVLYVICYWFPRWF